MSDEFEDYLENLQSAYEEIKNKNNQLQTTIAASGLADRNNAIEYQLDTNDLLDRLEHDLKGDYQEVDKEENVYWAKCKDPNIRILNDFGVLFVMGKIRKYIDKHTSLSIYTEERIYEILADIGDELRINIFCKYEILGLDTPYKKSEYHGLVMGILHTIETEYRKAIGGRTSERVNSTSIFTQSDNMRQQTAPQMRKKFNIFNPRTW